MKALLFVAAVALLAGCESNRPMSQAEFDYKMQRSMQILQGWQATRPQAPAIQPSGIQHCRHYYVGSTLRTECM